MRAREKEEKEEKHKKVNMKGGLGLKRQEQDMSSLAL